MVSAVPAEGIAENFILKMGGIFILKNYIFEY